MKILCAKCLGLGIVIDLEKSIPDCEHGGWKLMITMTCPDCNGKGKPLSQLCPHGHEDWDDCPDCRH